MTLTTLNNAKGQSQYKENYINKYKYIGKHYILSKYFTTKKQTLNFLVHVVFWEKNLSPCSISKLFMPLPPLPATLNWPDVTPYLHNLFIGPCSWSLSHYLPDLVCEQILSKHFECWMSSKPMQTINIRKIYLIKLHVCCMSILIDNTYGLNANNSLYFDLAEILYNTLKFFWQ